MMKKWKRLAALALAASMTFSLAACDSGTEKQTEELGSGDAKWSEEQTADGWMRVTNEGGKILGYSPDSGITLLQADGYAFKDLDRDGELDVYEDWREDTATRAADLASQMGEDEILPLMIHESVFTISDNIDEDPFKAFLDEGKRTVLQFGVETYPAASLSNWNNSMQAYVEGQRHGVPVNISTNPLTFGLPGNLAVAATFDTDYANRYAQKLSEIYRSQGVSTFLGPQIDLTTDPRWGRTNGALGEDPALSRDMTNALISGYQSTYDNGSDLGWGEDSIVAMMKHFPGDGTGESGRESHQIQGKYAVYPGENFEAGLINFFDGGLKLDSVTGQSAGVMPSYSIAYSEDGKYGEAVGSAFSEWKISLLRDNGYDGLICSDWGVTAEYVEGSTDVITPWGMEDGTEAEHMYAVLKAGCDQIGGTSNLAALTEGYSTLKEEIGEEEALAQIQNSVRRLFVTLMDIGLFDNPYTTAADAEALLTDAGTTALAEEGNLGSIVMLKNSNETIKAADPAAEKPTAYIPMLFTAASTYGGGASWALPVDLDTVSQYYNVVTDTIADPSGPEGTYTEADIIRATAADLAECDLAIVIVNNPQNENGQNGGYDAATKTYYPLSLQYGEYTANSVGVRTQSISGDSQQVEVTNNPYVSGQMSQKENRAYYGKASRMTNVSNLEGIQNAIANLPESASIIVCANCDKAMIVSEFEADVDAILVGFGIDNNYFLQVTSGNYEPCGLLPLQFPSGMETVEAQKEDVPRDMECYVDADGNTYDFAYGLNWSGVIKDERVSTYSAAPLTSPESITVTYAK